MILFLTKSCCVINNAVAISYFSNPILFQYSAVYPAYSILAGACATFLSFTGALKPLLLASLACCSCAANKVYCLFNVFKLEEDNCR